MLSMNGNFILTTKRHGGPTHCDWVDLGFPIEHITPEWAPKKLPSRAGYTEAVATKFPWIVMFHLRLFLGVYTVLF